jgi:hypothetical protein
LHKKQIPEWNRIKLGDSEEKFGVSHTCVNEVGYDSQMLLLEVFDKKNLKLD